LFKRGNVRIFIHIFNKHAYNRPMPISTVRFSPSSLGFLFNDISRKLRRHFDAQMSQFGLTQAQWQALLTVATFEGCTQKELADVLEVQPISMARLIDRMARGGWVRREPDPNDRRAHRLFLTSQCDPVLELAQAASKKIVAKAYEGMSQLDQERLLAYLEHIKLNLQNEQE
jgi:MarR family transcriptional regulator for hemolysin